MAKYAIENKTPDSKEIETSLNKKDIAKLTEILKIDVIHISEVKEIEQIIHQIKGIYN